MIKMTDDMRELVNKALADNMACLVSTIGEDGYPNVGPKGSVLVYDDETLAYWERSHRSALAGVRKNPKMMVYYRNPGAQGRVPPGGAWRFYGRAEVHEQGPIREKVKSMVVKAELDKDPENKGIAVLIHVDKIADLASRIIQSR
jgi:predicted pyridoxine 5'-phosphate oxidase superfamily flavin-nucleotide-binding protein